MWFTDGKDQNLKLHMVHWCWRWQHKEDSNYLKTQLRGVYLVKYVNRSWMVSPSKVSTTFCSATFSDLSLTREREREREREMLGDNSQYSPNQQPNHPNLVKSIPCVGKILQDHIFFYGWFRPNPQSLTFYVQL